MSDAVLPGISRRRAGAAFRYVAPGGSLRSRARCRGYAGRVDQDLALPGLPREKVLAAVVRLLETTFIRVGNEEYARQNDSFGLTTLRDRQVQVRGSRLRFRFRGKSGVEHRIELSDHRLAAIVRRMHDLPGEELFQYHDEQGEQGASSGSSTAPAGAVTKQPGQSGPGTSDKTDTKNPNAPGVGTSSAGSSDSGTAK